MSTNNPEYQIQALEECLKQIERGVSVEETLQQYPELAKELRPLLEAARQTILAATSITVPEGSQAQSRAAFLNAAQELQQARPAFSLGAFLSGILLPSLARAALVLLMVVLIGGATAFGVSARSLPGDTLYSLKLATERTRLILTRDTQKRLELQKSFDQERVEEVQTLASQARTSEVEFAGALQSGGPGGWQVGGITLLVGTETEGEEELASGAYVEVTGKVLSSGEVQVASVRARSIEFKGAIESISQAEWVVAGITIRLAADTIIEGSPAPGREAEVKALLMADGGLQARRIRVEEEKSGSTKSHEEETETSTAAVMVKESEAPTPTPTITATQEPSETLKASKTPEPSKTPRPSRTPESTERLEETRSPEPSKTDEPNGTNEPERTETHEPSETPSP